MPFKCAQTLHLCPYKAFRVLYLYPYKCAQSLWSYPAGYHTLPRFVKHPHIRIPTQYPIKLHQTLINTPKTLTITPDHSTILTYSHGAHLMSVAYQKAQKQRYRVTLELEVFDDMDPLQIQWDRVLDLEPAEKVEAYVEDLSTPDRWWFSSNLYYKRQKSFDSIMR